MVSIRRSGKSISGIFWSQGKIWLRVEVTGIEGKGAYWRSQFESGTDLISSALNWRYKGQSHVRGEPIIVQGERKEEEGRVLSGGY